MSSDLSSKLLQKYKNALGNAKMGLWELDFTTNVLSWDEGIQRLYESERDILSYDVENFYLAIHPDDSTRMRMEIDNSRIGLANVDSLFRITLANGKDKRIRTNAVKVVDNQGRITGLIGMNWDVTNEYNLQYDLNKAKAFLEKIIDSIPDPIFIKDSSHRTILLNKAFEKILGKNKSEILGKLDSEFLPQNIAELYWQQDIQVMRRDESYEFEEVIINSEGDERQLLTKKTSFNVTDDEKVLIGVIRDITEIKRIQKSLIEQSKMASLGEMAAGIAHEINNPLMIIQAKSQILQDKLDQKIEKLDSLKFSNDLHSIELNSIRIDKIIKSLKSISRKSDSDPFEENSIISLINEAIEISKDRFNANQIQLTFSFDNIIDETYKVKVHGSEIVQVLVNLLNNAFDAVIETKLSWVRINLSLLETSFKIEVVDSGLPIPAAVSAKMMEPFFTTKKTGSGTGLGLSVSKQIIKNHSGDFYYDSESKSTKFVFHLKRSESISNL